MRCLGYLAVLSCAIVITANAEENQRAPEPTWSGSGTAKTAPRDPGRAHWARTNEFMAVTANRHATEAAVRMMEQGGNAVDAAVAAQLVLGLVEPQSSGLGGGGFALYWQSEQKKLYSYDGREAAPAAIRSDHYMSPDGKPMGFWDAVIGGHSVGVPGIPALLAEMHAEHGKLSWARLFDPAIELAERGFAVSPRLHLLLKHVPRMRTHPHTRHYFFPNGKLPKPGYRLRNPSYARTLKRFRKHGASIFYRGAIARDIVESVQRDRVRRGLLRMSDMRRYRVRGNDPLCSTYRRHVVCSAPPPSSGGIAVLTILGTLQHWDTRSLTAAHPRRIHLFAEASRQAFADRNTWVADPNFMPIPAKRLVDADYLRERSRQIRAEQSAKTVSTGISARGAQPGEARSPEPPSTSHFSMADRHGNIISMTSSIEGAFGSRIIVGGFLLNNQLSDFSFRDRSQQGELILNSPAGRKRPRSSMSPTIVFDDTGTKPILAIGSPGGTRIIDYVAQSIWLYLDTDIGLAKSVEAGRVVHTNRGALELESGRYTPELIHALERMGHVVRERRQGSGIHAIAFHPDGSMLGVADPRREGLAAGR